MKMKNKNEERRMKTFGQDKRQKININSNNISLGYTVYNHVHCTYLS